jgi:glycosyltransferase involved in cell wall biosynthesis
MDVSVCICTWNRAEDLRRTLKTLRALRVPDSIQWELLVVDNNSNDHTQDVCASFGDLPLRVEREPEQGIARARNRALDSARGALLLWCDDDETIDPGWMEAYLAATEAHPDAGYFGGPLLPVFDPPVPAWLERGWMEVKEAFSFTDYGTEPRAIAKGETLPNGNFAIRASVARQHRYDAEFGNVGDSLRLGEDTAVMESLQASDVPGFWVPAAVVRHHMPQDRMTLPSVAERYQAQGYFEGARRTHSRVGRAIGCFIRSLENRARFRVARALGAHPERWLCRFRRAHDKWGRLRGLLHGILRRSRRS